MTALRDLGLSSYEETAYRTLLVTGAVTATELSEQSGVPKGRIYDVLNGLEARDLIQRQSAEPNRYAAVRPAAVVDRLLAERADELRREWERYRERASTIRSNLAPAPPAESSFWPGSLGGDEMSTALREHVRTADDVVRAAVGVPYENATWETLRAEVDAFFEGAGADLSVDLLFSEEVVTVLPERFPRLIEEHSADVTVRTIPDSVVSFDVIDRMVTSVDVPHPVSKGDRIGVLGITDSAVVEEFDRCFQRLWADADPLLE